MRKLLAALVLAASIVTVTALPAAAKNSPTITAKEFAKLQPGMTLRQARQIVGGRGTLLSTGELVGTTTSMYTWKGESLGANAFAMFQGPVGQPLLLVTKAQFGLS